MNEHSCIIIDPRDTDYIKDQNSPIIFKAIQGDGDWTEHIDFFEWQKFVWDTDACVFFAQQESFDAQVNHQIENGQVSLSLMEWLTANGYMDGQSRDGTPRFHSSPRFAHVLAGTKFNGASLPAAWDMARKYGVLPWTDLPFTAATTVDEYFAAIPQESMDKAAKFLALIGGKDSIQYHWIVNGVKGTQVQKLKTALMQAPLCIGTAVCEPWNQLQPPSCPMANPAHSTMIYKMDTLTRIFDHYEPFLKQFDFQYNIPYALQGIVTINYTPEIPAVPQLPTNPTRPQISSWLDAVKQWLTIILTTIKGRNLGSTNMVQYSIFKSRTFWTLAFGFVYSVWQLLSPSVPVQYSTLIEFIFGAVATYFHVDGVKKAAFTSATEGRPLSGQ